MTSYAVLAIFKKESLILSEWINHYLTQGASRVILVNNNSDHCWEQVVSVFGPDPRLSFFTDRRSHSQVEIYNDILASGLIQAEWLLVCDLDEFLYSRFPYDTIIDYLSVFDLQNVATIKIPWKMFGSSGFVDQPVENVRASFLWRANHGHSPSVINCKYLVRVDRAKTLDVHFANISGGLSIRPSGFCVENTNFVESCEPDLMLDFIHLNHYAIQSREYLKKVKMTRGDVHNPASDSLLNMDYFQAYDSHDILDEELSKLLTSQSSNSQSVL